ncbi:YpdA family putative bacillithiol disulfide reductase [Psychroflexus sp. CAK57W]|uniref:YpdA family putative bacillithiol disulfide reductase n=1 Tax=Psychroflexus curvus TaxID=2873595 RepID=UPI001CCA4044|nr:YpdA family putative bacillithiol disulfide reductase [Psychroflexus curvus]MBZ9627979.1 YpdA family putative bacillithiol disulfide reductase [Psychroflexus curvus]MBZ9787677.1 YpdA family putative bacillithiol disulfide reductase [Psychroflexus curvus]
MVYDVLIVGGGPIGIACALEAKKKNLSYIILEKGALVNSLYNYPDKMTFFSTSEKLELDHIPFVSNNPKPSKQEALEYYRRIVESKQVQIQLFEKVENVSSEDHVFTTTTSKSTYQSKNLVIATGFYDIPNYLNIPGEDLDKVTHYYGDPHYYATQKVVVVGASNSSVDAALETYRKGAEVTMIVRGEQIGERVKYWVRPDVINRIKEGSIKAFFNSELTEVGEDYVKFKDEEGKIQTLENDFVLALTGYRPNFEFLKKLGIELSDDQLSIPNYDKQTMKTNVDGIYLAGVICGGMETHKWFIENSRIHAKMIMEDIKS